MEVILLDDITNLGHEGDVVQVADGYARNYLIPQKFVVEATAGNLKQLENRRRAIQDREDQKRTQLENRRRAIQDREDQKRTNALELAAELNDKSIIVRASVGEGGRLHGEVTAQNITEAVAEQLGVEISRRDVDIPTPIRERGNYLISAALYQDVTVELPVRVIGLTEDEEQAQIELEQTQQPSEQAAAGTEESETSEEIEDSGQQQDNAE